MTTIVHPILSRAGELRDVAYAVRDGAVVGSAVSVPLWLQHVDGWLAALVPPLALVLLAYQIACKHREFTKRGRD